MTNENNISDLLELDCAKLVERLKKAKSSPLGRVRQLNGFLDALLSDVFCRQLLPEAFTSVSRMTGYEFTFRPEIRLPKDPWQPGCCSIAVAVSSFANQLQQVLVIFSEPIFSGVLADFNGRERQLAYAKIVLLNRLLSGTLAQLDILLNDSCLQPIAFVRFDNESCLRIVVKFKPNRRARLQDLVADLIANCYDVAVLQPFLIA